MRLRILIPPFPGSSPGAPARQTPACQHLHSSRWCGRTQITVSRRDNLQVQTNDQALLALAEEDALLGCLGRSVGISDQQHRAAVPARYPLFSCGLPAIQ